MCEHILVELLVDLYLVNDLDWNILLNIDNIYLNKIQIIFSKEFTCILS